MLSVQVVQGADTKVECMCKNIIRRNADKGPRREGARAEENLQTILPAKHLQKRSGKEEGLGGRKRFTLQYRPKKV
jgi:hypothetical protein